MSSAEHGTWFDDARFGMFIHWDPASQRGWEVSWPMAGGIYTLPFCQSVTPEDYHAQAATFRPESWNPVELMELARACGMKYVVFTTRHHNGFAMFDSAAGGHGVREHLESRDLFGELVSAARGAGLRVGAYYSLSDWHHPDYPPLTVEHRPYLLGFHPPMPSEEQAERFRAYLLDQLTELLTNYGQIDVLWFDGQWERSPDWWDVDRIAALARRLQPDILINDRLPGHGDFLTPEQFIPPAPLDQRWECCMTVNDSWGWNPSDTHHRSAHELVRTLCETAGRGGNLLLNVSPRGDGSLPPEQLDRLASIRSWMERHGRAIHSTRAGLESWQFYGPSTRRDNEVFLFVLGVPNETITVRGIQIRRVSRVSVMGTGESLAFRTRTDVLNQLGYDPPGELTIEIPSTVIDPLVTVVVIEFALDVITERGAVARVSP